MKQKGFYLTLLGLLLVLLTGCGQGTEQPAAQPDGGEAATGEQTLADTLSGALEEAGYTPAQPKEVSGSSMYGETNTVHLDVDPEGEGTSALTIYRFDTPADAQEASQGFDAKDPSYFERDNGDGTTSAMIVDYVAPITLYLQEDSIVLYCGEDEAVLDLLTQTLGEPFAGTLCR